MVSFLVKLCVEFLESPRVVSVHSQIRSFPFKPFLENKCAVNCTGLLPLHFPSQLVRSAKARLKTLDAEAKITSVSHSMLLSADVVSSDVMPSCSSSQEVLKIVVDVNQKP